ncbi:MAG: hypothetical protein ACU833_14080 [Gammaproteobacteria bacterium]
MKAEKLFKVTHQNPKQKIHKFLMVLNFMMMPDRKNDNFSFFSANNDMIHGVARNRSASSRGNGKEFKNGGGF